MSCSENQQNARQPDIQGPYQAWSQEEHAGHSGLWNRLDARKLSRTCDGFNEFRLFRTLVGASGVRSLADIGCAAGAFYRYFRKAWPSLEYTGFDISEAAITEAKRLYPKADFRLYGGSLDALHDVEADIVFCRDVVHHQVDPSGFLSSLYGVAQRYLLLRVRTKEIGETIFDPALSCQYTYGHWVPYIVFNTSRLVDLLRSFAPSPRKITVWKHPVILGGRFDRFLPKELYYLETGTAETAVLIEKGTGDSDGDGLVTLETKPELTYRGWNERMLRGIARRLGA